MKEKEPKVPKLRFPEFKNAPAWEQRKFGEVFTFPISTNTLSRSKLNYSEGEVKNIHYGDILVNLGFIVNGDSDVLPFITGSVKNKYKNQLLQNGDIVIADTAEDYNAGKVVEIADFSIEDNVVSGLHTYAYRPNIDFGKYYLGYYMNSNSYHNQILPLLQGTKVYSLSKKNLMLTNVIYPCNVDEQSRIGSFFSELDHLITLHQRKLENLENQKKSLLQRMFPKKGETTPELRFPGFTDDWEQCKFENIWERTSIKNTDLEYSQDDIISVSKMKYANSNKNSTEKYMKTYFKINKGDIAFEGNKSKHYSYGRFVLNDIGSGIVSHVFITFTPKIEMNMEFMKEYINNENVMKHILVKATTKTLMMTTLNVKDINKQLISIPSLQEQQQIGEFFQKQDQLITFQQRKIDHLNDLKKGLLQQMFV
ncbi:type I restriction enzyme, S subunit [Granulicatella balaenopterae]|uniref:Type I restriction enzyme, S subunit n=1 Tax=Granulicatella balaenopterae TaxID=137733 RepID=A0A1H9NIC0_9LACT|nr:restriction endonuclease subunit S [Granulicatella balaenopterae]SER35714.1 type I restriction enzyme, S subunit [Granulicatella balaenopterae]